MKIGQINKNQETQDRSYLFCLKTPWNGLFVGFHKFSLKKKRLFKLAS